MFSSITNLVKSTVNTANNLVKAVEVLSEVPVAAAERAVEATKSEPVKKEDDEESK